MSDHEQDEILYQEHPAMFRNSPVWFILCLISVIGWPVLLVWYLQTRSAMLTITDSSIIVRRGLLSKNENEIRIKHVRNVQIRQTLFQRIMGTGYIGISSAGQSGVEIQLNGLPNPDDAKEIINAQLEEDEE